MPGKKGQEALEARARCARWPPGQYTFPVDMFYWEYTENYFLKIFRQLTRISFSLYAKIKHVWQSYAHRSAKASENLPNGRAKSVQCRIHRDLKI